MSIHASAASIRVGLLATCLPFWCPTASAKIIDDCSDAEQWAVVNSEGVELKCSEDHQVKDDDDQKTTLRLDIDFVSGAGYAGIRRTVPINLPANFELAFSVRGDLPPNDLEFKLLDESGETVWWVNRRRFEFPHEWKRLASRRRHFEFAWGPSDAPLKRVSAIEIVIAAAEGGRGTAYLDDLTFRPLPESKPYTGTPTLAASSHASTDTLPKFANDDDARTSWRSASVDAEPVLTMDFGQMREFGGLALNWDPAATAERYSVQLSDDGEKWTDARTVTAGGTSLLISLPDAEARAVRLAMGRLAGGKQVALREIEVLPLEASRDPNAFAAEVASRAPRGYYPRACLGEGTFWTIVGTPQHDDEALVSEDGAVEVNKRSFTIEPFLYVDGQLLTWADATTSQSLAAGCAPVPNVLRTHENLTLAVTAVADGELGRSTLWLMETVTNSSKRPIEGALLLAIRPFQVNPPYQWLNTVGGVAKVGHIAVRDAGRVIEVDEKEVTLGVAPDAFGCATFDEGDVTTFLSRGQVPRHDQVDDPQHSASAAVEYRFRLEPGASRRWVACIPFSSDERGNNTNAAQMLASPDPVEFVRKRRQTIVDQWMQATSTFDLLLPTERTDLLNTIRSTLAYILINRDGPAIQPGSRSYERSWIRDGSLTATALLRFGMDQPAREFVDWYAPYQFDSGKVPCVVDRRGPDPVPENDSHGQFIMAVMNVYRFSSDETFLRKHWPRVQKAVAYIESLRAERMTEEFSDPQTTATRQEPNQPAVSNHAFYGLMPESISHEGYSAKPMHSYWDDFFTLRGLKDAADMAHVLGVKDDAQRYQTLADDFAHTLYASLELARHTHGIDYLPGCVELGDFDATSTTVALWPCDEMHRLPRLALDRTFERYWEEFVRRRDDPTWAWEAYTPYELRVIGSFVLLGQKERALEALEYFLRERRPPAWNQWPEVVFKEPRTARFVGDLPHTWCGSDFLNSVRMMFLYERENDQSLVLLAGMPASWVTNTPVGFKNMPTYGGRVSCTIKPDLSDDKHFTAHVSGSCLVPSGAIRLAGPRGPVASASINGRSAEIDDEGLVVIKQLPAKVHLSY